MINLSSTLWDNRYAALHTASTLTFLHGYAKRAIVQWHTDKEICQLTTCIDKSYSSPIHYLYSLYVEPLIFKMTRGRFGSEHLKQLTQKKEALEEKKERLESTSPFFSWKRYALTTTVLEAVRQDHFGICEFLRDYFRDYLPLESASDISTTLKPPSFDSLPVKEKATHILSGIESLKEDLQSFPKLKICPHLIFDKVIGPLINSTESETKGCQHLIREFHPDITRSSETTTDTTRLAYDLLKENCPTNQRKWAEVMPRSFCYAPGSF